MRWLFAFAVIKTQGDWLLREKVNKPVVTVFADDNKKYLSTELANPIVNNKEYISNKIELLNYENVMWRETTNRK